MIGKALTTLLAGALAAGVAVPARAASSAPRTLDGVWRVDGYGESDRISHGTVQRYESSPAGCLAGEVGHAAHPSPTHAVFDFADDDPMSVRVRSAGEAVAHVESATSVRYLHRVAQLPAACTQPAPTGPRAVFDTFWSTFAANYPFFALHGVDWTAMRARYRPQVTASTTPQQLYRILTAMVAPLHDEHVAVFGPDPSHPFNEVRPGTRQPTAALDAKLRTELARVDLPAAGATADALHYAAQDRIAWAALPGHIEYLRLSGFTGYTRSDSEDANRAELQRVLAKVFRPGAARTWRGLMIDLRVNGGGSDRLAIDVARHLTTSPYVAYAKEYRRGPVDRVEWSRPQPTTVAPSAGTNFGGPVTLLISGSTVSAGETFTQSLLGRSPAPLLVGENTQGVYSDVLERSLSNGWTFLLPNERYLNSAGRSYDVHGIAPDVRAPLVTSGADRLFTEALRRTRCSPGVD